MQRPHNVNVFAGLNILFGVLGLLCLPVQFIGALTLGTLLVRFVLIGAGWVASGVLLASGVGMLRLSSWSRRVAVGWSIVALCLSVANEVC